MTDQPNGQLRAVHFHVTEGAQTQMLGGMPLLYVGMTYHIPRREIDEAQRIFDETQDPGRAQQVIEHVDVSPDQLMHFVAEHGYTAVPDAVLERFDTVDGESGDLLVLLRVPCMPSPRGQESTQD